MIHNLRYNNVGILNSWGRHDLIVVGYTTTYGISAYHH